MNVSKLLRFLLSRVLCMGIVEGEGGGAATVEGDPDTDEGADGDDAGEGEGDDAAGEGAEGEGEEGEGEGEGSTTDEVVVTIGDEEPPADEGEDGKPAAPWVRDLRKSNREKDKRIRELERQVAAGAPAPQTVVVGEKPTFENCGFDADKFETELSAWNDRKRQADEQQRKTADAEKKAKDDWQSRLDSYTKAKATIKVKDFDDAEDVVKDLFTVTQQAIIVKGVGDPTKAAQIIYALGKNPKRAKALAAVSDPVEFAVQIGELKGQIKVIPKKQAPAPDRQVRGAAAGAAVVDKPLERLRAEAEKTGDYTKVAAYKQQQRDKKRA